MPNSDPVRRQKVLVSLVMACLAFTAQGQVIPMTKVLASADQDLRVTQSEELARHAAALQYHIPLIKEVEARLGIRGSLLGDTIYGYLRNEDLYALQITANSLREIRSQKAYKAAEVTAYQAETALFREEAIYKRYVSLAEWHFAWLKSTAYLHYLELLTKKQELLRLRAENGIDFRVKDIIANEDDLLKASDKQVESNTTATNCLDKIRQYTAIPEGVSPDTVHFISVEEIIAYVDQSGTSTIKKPEIYFREQTSALSAAKWNTIRAQNRQIFNSIRLNYDDPLYLDRPSKFNPMNNFSVRIGLTIPLPGNNRFRSSRAILDLKESQFATQRASQNLIIQQELQLSKLKGLLDRYIQCRNQEEKSLIPGLLANPELRNALSAEERIDLEIIRQEMQLRSLEVSSEVTLSYLNLLYLNGQLQAHPRVNWLSKQAESW